MHITNFVSIVMVVLLLSCTWPTELKTQTLSVRCIYSFIYFFCLTGMGI